MKRVRLVMVLVLLLTLIVQTQVQAQEDERVLVIGHAESTDSYDPARGFTQTTGIVNRVTYDTLVTFPDDDAGEILPLLAEDWTISEDSLQYTFTLREDVNFADGSPIEASDVVFSIQRLQNVNGNPSFLANNIASVEAVDERTVTFTLTQVRPSFLAELSNYAFSVSNAELVMANGGTDADDAAESDTAGEFLDTNSAGSGPYILEEWSQQDETVLVRNENYWGEQPYFDRVIIVNIPEPATQAIALEAGDIDLALDLSADQVNALEGNPTINIWRGPSVIIHFILMNQDPEIGGPVSDPLVQRAIRLALDYEGFQALWGGFTPGSNLSGVLPYAYTSETGEALERDLETARALMAEAGYADGFDITLQHPDFSWQGVNMNTNAQKIQADLAEIGINVSLEPGELQVSLEQYRNGEQGFAHWFWGPDILDPLDFLSFLPGGKVAEERLNWTRDMASDELLALIDAAAVATDPAEREELFGELQTWMQLNGPFAPFVQPDLQFAFLNDIEGFIWHPQWGLDVSLLSRAE